MVRITPTTTAMPPEYDIDETLMESSPASMSSSRTKEQNGASLGSLSKTTTTTDAATSELIHTLDTAFAEVSSFAATAARDAEVARQNARAAAEIARRYRTGGGTTTTTTNGDHGNDNIDKEEEDEEVWDDDELEALNDDGLSPLPLEKNNDSASAPLFMENGTHGEDSWDDHEGLHTSPPLPPPPPPLPHQQHQKHQPPPPSLSLASTTTTPHRNNTQKGNVRQQQQPKTPSSVERLANSHAEDVLSLSLELERTKQALQLEKEHHKATQTEVTVWKAKNAEKETQLQSLLHEKQTLEEEHTQKVENLTYELSQSTIRVEAAEEDAELALEMAKENAESREQMEQWLQRSLQEVQLLREQLEQYQQQDGGDSNGNSALPLSEEDNEKPPASSSNGMDDKEPSSSSSSSPPKKKKAHVRFSDEIQIQSLPSSGTENVVVQDLEPEPEFELTPGEVHVPVFTNVAATPPQEASSSGSPKSMIAAGRSLLQRNRLQQSPSSEDTNDDDDDNVNVDPVYCINFTPEKSTERREKLRERLRALGIGGDTKVTDDDDHPQHHDGSVMTSPGATSIHHTPSSLSSPYHHNKHSHHHTHGIEIGYASKAIESCKVISNLMKESGKRLDLGGHYFRTPGATTTTTPSKDKHHQSSLISPPTPKTKEDVHVNIESLARHYCNSVEVKFGRQNDELKELESLCDYLERKLAEIDETNFGDLSSSD